MPKSWTVYTVEDKGGGVFNIVKTRWTEGGPDTDNARIAKVLTGLTAEEAQQRCVDMQAGYDAIRQETQPE